MKVHPEPFLGLEDEFSDLERAAAVIVPYPYEGGVSYGRGTAKGPEAVIAASHFLELYDEVLDAEPFKAGIATLAAPDVPDDPAAMIATLEKLTDRLCAQGRWVLVLGGDHSITTGFARTLCKHHAPLGVIQFDAHADLREAYEGSGLSHACTMARIRELTAHTLQLGIRSMSADEAARVKDENLSLATMADLRGGRFDVEAALAALPDKVMITFDVDVFDWSVVAATGTPEPGGMCWDEAMDLLAAVFARKTVVGADVVELSARPGDPNSPFAVAKLIYKMIGMRFASPGNC